jgi:hypothetical protein
VIGDEDSVRGHPLFGDVPRMVVEWDGRTWQPVAVADNYAAAYEIITQPGRPPLFPQPTPRCRCSGPAPADTAGSRKIPHAVACGDLRLSRPAGSRPSGRPRRCSQSCVRRSSTGRRWTRLAMEILHRFVSSSSHRASARF